MSRPVSRSARSIAVEVLDRFDAKRDYAATILDRVLDRTDQKQRATDLVFGTIRNLVAIDTIIACLSGRPTKRIDRRLLNIIRVGVYELLYSPETPDYSIVNEAVDLAKTAGAARQTGFVNAVLRGIIRHILSRDAPLAEAAPTRTFLRTPLAGCEFDTDLLPDPQTALAEYLGTCFSLPVWLVTEWMDRFGPETVRQICLACNRRPSLYVRVNPLKTTASALLQRFQQHGIKTEVVPPGETQACFERSRRDVASLRVSGPHSVAALPGFTEGQFTVQDISASKAACALSAQPGWAILDLCAAPGTKTTQLAESTQDTASIIATDIAPERLERLRENVTRLGIKSVTIMPPPQIEESGAGSYDAVLVDAPCSNTGVLAKRVEVRLRITPGSIQELARTQRSLLDKAATLVKPTGRICYSTCSIQRAENTDVVRAFLNTHPQFELTDEELTLPSPDPFDHDGAYVALLTRRGE
jgi:16S rRNA (cytosine967-C5)-methyltransferase